jgi:hypothetical protein
MICQSEFKAEKLKKKIQNHPQTNYKEKIVHSKLANVIHVIFFLEIMIRTFICSAITVAAIAKFCLEYHYFLSSLPSYLQDKWSVCLLLSSSKDSYSSVAVLGSSKVIKEFEDFDKFMDFFWLILGPILGPISSPLKFEYFSEILLDFACVENKKVTFLVDKIVQVKKYKSWGP